jgi:hypothetical protein
LKPGFEVRIYPFDRDFRSGRKHALPVFNLVSVLQIRLDATIAVIRAGDGAGSVRIGTEETWIDIADILNSYK